MADDTLARAVNVLIAHQRFDIQRCACGWAELGKSHPKHVAGVLAAAGLLVHPADCGCREVQGG